jgi:hypothetical protein
MIYVELTQSEAIKILQGYVCSWMVGGPFGMYFGLSPTLPIVPNIHLHYLLPVG